MSSRLGSGRNVKVTNDTLRFRDEQTILPHAVQMEGYRFEQGCLGLGHCRAGGDTAG